MAFKLDKQEIGRRDQIVTDLTEGRDKLEDALAVYNDEVTKLRQPLDAAVLAYNEAVESARGFAEDIATQADGEIDDKSDRWREGENGQAATAWKDEWEGALFEEVSVEYPEDIVVDGVDHAETLDQLPEAGT